jgi:hypothetical protein
MKGGECLVPQFVRHSGNQAGQKTAELIVDFELLLRKQGCVDKSIVRILLLCPRLPKLSTNLRKNGQLDLPIKNKEKIPTFLQASERLFGTRAFLACSQ